jgi:anti-sigma B factor antagonist
MVPASSFSTAVESLGPRLNVVIARGEIDLLHAEDFEDEMRSAVVGYRTVDLIVDLTEVTFIDSSGANALVRVLEHQRTANRELAIVTNDKRVTSLFEVSRLDRVLRRFDSRDDAVRALEST